MIGFTVGPSVGVQPWVVALVADVALVWRARAVPWRSIPWATAVIAGSLAVLATAAADELPIRSWLSGTGPAALARTIGVSAAGANLVNNLPAFLVGSSRIGHHESPRLWALLLGVNVGPTLLVTGTLAGLLWLDSVRRLDLDVGPAAFFRAGLRVGIPALLASGAAGVLVEQLVLGHPRRVSASISASKRLRSAESLNAARSSARRQRLAAELPARCTRGAVGNVPRSNGATAASRI